MKVRLTRLHTDNVDHAMRTDSIEGHPLRALKIGTRFSMTAPPLDPAADLRLFSTSEVVGIEDGEDGTLFVTESGTRYKLESI